MAYGNATFIVGNLTRDPEQRYTPSGAGVCNFSIAVNRKYESGGQQKEETSFFDCVAWGELGENVSASLHKGQRVVVVGRLDQRSWETTSGEKRSKVELTCEAVGADLRFADRGERRGPASQPPASYGDVYDDQEPF